MHKTLHKKLTEKHLYASLAQSCQDGVADMHDIAICEQKLREDLSKDLLQPRPEAIAYILRMSRDN